MYVSTGTDDPVQRVSWDAATADWDADGYRLPTEMEWTWAAMGADQDAKPGDSSERNCLGLLPGFGRSGISAALPAH